MEKISTAKKILFAPHNDDEALFVSFTCLREKPVVVIVTDSWKQFNRGEKEITAEVRRNESLEAMKILGCSIVFLGIPDNKLTRKVLLEKLEQFTDVEVVYAPAIQGGNAQHDLVGSVVLGRFRRVIQYSTYSKESDYTTGEIEVKPTEEEIILKNKALDCYKSQTDYVRTAHHFDAVRGKSEWITKNTKLKIFHKLWNYYKK